MECKVDKVRTGRQGVINRCWEDNNRTGWRGKELGDMEMERRDEGDGRQRMGIRRMGIRVTEDGKVDKGQRMEDRVMEVVGNRIRKT